MLVYTVYQFITVTSSNINRFLKSSHHRKTVEFPLKSALYGEKKENRLRFDKVATMRWWSTFGGGGRDKNNVFSNATLSRTS